MLSHLKHFDLYCKRWLVPNECAEFPWGRFVFTLRIIAKWVTHPGLSVRAYVTSWCVLVTIATWDSVMAATTTTTGLTSDLFVPIVRQNTSRLYVLLVGWVLTCNWNAQGFKWNWAETTSSGRARLFCSASELCSLVSERTELNGKRPLVLGNNISNWSRCDNGLKRFLISLWCSLHSDSKRPRLFNLHWALLQRRQLVLHVRAPCEPASRPAVAGGGGRETLVAVRKRKGMTLNKSPRSEGDSSFVENA